MSTDIYIPLTIVLSHPGQFQFKAALNGDMQDAIQEVNLPDQRMPDWDYVETIMKPVLLCKFGARESWKVVEVFDLDLHVSVGGQFRDWLLHWLDSHAYKYHHINGD